MWQFGMALVLAIAALLTGFWLAHLYRQAKARRSHESKKSDGLRVVKINVWPGAEIPTVEIAYDDGSQLVICETRRIPEWLLVEIFGEKRDVRARHQALSRLGLYILEAEAVGEENWIVRYNDRNLIEV